MGAILWAVEVGLGAAVWFLAPRAKPARPNRRPWND